MGFGCLSQNPWRKPSVWLGCEMSSWTVMRRLHVHSAGSLLARLQRKWRLFHQWNDSLVLRCKGGMLKAFVLIAMRNLHQGTNAKDRNSSCLKETMTKRKMTKRELTPTFEENLKFHSMLSLGGQQPEPCESRLKWDPMNWLFLLIVGQPTILSMRG